MNPRGASYTLLLLCLLLSCGCAHTGDPVVGSWKDATAGVSHVTFRADGTMSLRMAASAMTFVDMNGTWRWKNETLIEFTYEMQGMPVHDEAVYDPAAGTLAFQGLKYRRQ